MNLTRGKFISFEGIEGLGKTTAVAFMKQYLTEKKIPCITTREPGGTSVAEAIRQVLLQHYTEPMLPETELLLLFAGRKQHMVNLIEPALQAGQWVLCDRFTDASYAYQGGGRGINAERIAILEEWVLGDFRPDLTLLLDAEVTLSRQRIKHRTPDRIEVEDHAFFEKIREAYLQRAKQYPRFCIINAAATLENVQQQMIHAVMNLLENTK
jgi:dTMP kinase